MSADRTAALLVRVWLEEGTDEFRARLSAVGFPPSDGPGDEVTLALTSSPSEVVDAVRQWIDDFVGHGTATD